MNYRLVLFTVFTSILEYYSIRCDVVSDILTYYNGDIVRSFQKQWENSRKSYENALKIAIIENFGKKSMNTIERRIENACKLSNGFYVYDNVVHVIFHDIHLKEMPHIKYSELYFPLANNVLSLQTELSKIILETKYNLMRNNSEVLFAGSNLDTYKNSPFVLQQVQTNGNLAIVAEDCKLSGFTIASLSGVLGHDTFRISNCKFTVEISAEGLGSPPVIAPYFSDEQSKEFYLNSLISNQIRKELMGKLQAAMFTYVNTSIFENDLIKYRNEQNEIFKKTSKLIKDVIRNANKEKIKTNKAAHDLRSLDIVWNETNHKCKTTRAIKLKDIVLDGFDSVYSPHIGGPYKLQKVGIAETLRYNTLKVRGKIFFEQDDFRSEHDFSMDLLDVTVNIDMNVEDTSQGFNSNSYVFWRDTVFSITNIENVDQRVLAESLITGYLINETPKYVSSILLKSTYPEKSKQTETEETNDKKGRNVEIDPSVNTEEAELSKNEENRDLSLPDNDGNLKEQENEAQTEDESTLKGSDIEKGEPMGVEVNIAFMDRMPSDENVQEAEPDPLLKNDDRLGIASTYADELLKNSYEDDRRRNKKRSNKKYKRYSKHRQDMLRTKKGMKKILKKRMHSPINMSENDI
ncbi:unnamed protein product, partial [Iphiclides podalirius]